MITYEKVMEEFQDYLKMDKDLEVVKLKHGYYLFIWEEIRNKYYYDEVLIHNTEQLVDALIDEMETFYKIKYGVNMNKITIDKQQTNFEMFMKKVKKNTADKTVKHYI